jgi:hypothetical protein
MSMKYVIKNENIISIFLLVTIFIFSIFWAILLMNTFHGDSTIYLTYARNIAAGDFFSFNTRQFSSGTTSPLWAMILSVGFLFPYGVYIAKIIGLIFTLLALFVTYRMALEISKSKMGSVLGSAIVLYFLAFPGLMMYESSLIVCLISILLILNVRIIRHYMDNQTIKNSLFSIFLIWSSIPLVRPDAVIIVFLNLFLLAALYYKNKKSVFLVFITFLLSFLPSILYFGYSYLTSGTFSVSSYCRAFALKEGAQSFLGLFYSFSTIKLFFKFPLILWLGFIFWGWGKYKNLDKIHQPLVYFSISVLSCYLLILSVISPVTRDAGRYILPVIPFLVPFASLGLADLWNIAVKRKYVVLLFGIILFFVAVPLWWITKAAVYEKKRGLSFDIITEKVIIEYLNSIAEPNATILIYEVQDRYYLRPDLNLLSLDGITDGKIAPYLASGDISSFLWKYKPKYWLANDAVFYRPFLSNSILKQVMGKNGIPEGNSVQIDGMTFTNVRLRKEPIIEGFSAYKQLYKIDYN